MRPRKVIPLYASELQMPLLRLPLECAGFRVIAENSPIGTLSAFAAEYDVDLVIYDAIGARDYTPIHCLKAMKAHIPVLVLGTEAQMASHPNHGGDAVLVRPSMAELIERARVMSARKRGPRKGSHRKAVAPDPRSRAGRVLSGQVIA